MPWFFAALISLVLDSAVALLYRNYAKHHPHNQFIANALMGMLGIVPIAIIWCLIDGGVNITISAYAWLYIVLAASFFVLSNSLIYIANTRVDASRNAILYGLKLITVIMLAALMLGERLSFLRLTGAGLAIAAAIIVSHYGKHGPEHTNQARYICYMAAGAIFAGIATIFEKLALGSTALSTYALLSWGLQCLFMTTLSWSQSKQIYQLKSYDFLFLGLMGLLHGMSGVTFVYALAACGSASIVTSIASTRIVLVAMGSYLLLRETHSLKQKIIGVILATLGVVLLAQ